MSRLRLQLAAAAIIFAVAWIQSARLEPKRESGVLPIDPPTPYIHYFPANTPRARVLAIHGLDVSKEVLSIISAALADGGLEVYAIDLPGHGDSDAKFQTDLAEQAIGNAKAYLGDSTIVLGHSLGAGLLLDLAASEHFSTLVLLSPPPISISEIHADHVLIATGEIDLPRIRAFVPIATDIGAPTVESWMLPWGAHSAPIFNPVYVRRIAEWLGGDGGKTRSLARMFWIILMFLASVGFGIALLPKTATRGQPLRPPEPVPTVLVRYIGACASALFILKFTNPLRWLRFFATDYLISFFLITGLILVLTARGRKSLSLRPADLLRGVAAAAFVIAAPGLIATSHVLHMTLSDDRWWRFPCIALAGFPFFLFDELTIRGIHPQWKSIAVAVITRVLLLAFLLTGVLLLNREKAFLVLIVPLIAVFWIALWFAAGVIYRHTQDPLAASIFAALVQAWAFASWFVTT